MALTDKAIKNFKPQEKQYKRFDGYGLYILVKPNGSKLWQKKYQYNNKEKVISFGKYPLVSLAEAREKTQSALKLLNENIDPLVARQREKFACHSASDHKFLTIAEKWFAIKKTKVSEKYSNELWRKLENHLFPTIGSIPIQEITAPMLINALEGLNQSDKLETLRRTAQNINEIMIFAKNTGVIKYNVAEGIKDAFAAPKATHMPTIPPSELASLMKMIYVMGNITPLTRYLMLWQLHTMVRPSEAVGAKWEEIDFEKKIWTIPAERMKKRREHYVPLSTQMIILLEELSPLTGNSIYLFPSLRAKKTHINVETVNTALKRNGFKGILVAHGFRSIASTYLNEEGINADWIEECLAHVPSNKVRASYNRAQYLEQRKDIMQKWSDFINEAIKKGIANK